MLTHDQEQKRINFELFSVETIIAITLSIIFIIIVIVIMQNLTINGP